tara:strand:- start:315 stop:1760 length:1446 start_codon:yes stop_codon:yes gene_type:complete
MENTPKQKNHIHDAPRGRGGIMVRYQSGFSTLYRLIDLSIISALYFLISYANNSTFNLINLTLLFVNITCYQIAAEAIELYRSWRGQRTIEMLRMAAITWLIGMLITISIAFFYVEQLTLSSVEISSWFVCSFFFLLVWRYIARKLLFKMRRSGRNSKEAIVVGATQIGYTLAQQIIENEQLGIRFRGIFDDRTKDRLPHEVRETVLGGIEAAIDKAKNNEVDFIYIALPMSAEDRIRHILEKCSDTTANVYIIPDFFIYNLLNARWQSIGNLQALSVYDTPFQGASDVIKRIEDVVFSTLILLFLMIPMGAIALAVKVTSKGPVIFKQKRYGLDGKQILVYKFRSMTTMDNGSSVKQATKNDPRITKLGAFLRRTSLDELPQFINVLQGRMSIVGPRPHAVAHNEQYRKLIKGYMLRHKVRPGITGWAQVNGFRGETDTVEKMLKRVQFDLDYIHRWSVWLDIKIILMTAFHGFSDKNAY